MSVIPPKMSPVDKRISPQRLTVVRQALFDAKLAIESGFEGEERKPVIREIILALDALSSLDDAS